MNILEWEEIGRFIAICAGAGSVIIITALMFWFAMSPTIKSQERQIGELTVLLKEVIDKCKK